MSRLLPLVVLISLCLAGCGAPAFSPAQAGPPRTDLSWGVVGLQDIPTLDPALAADPTSISLCSMIYGGLVRLDKNLHVQPDGAARWTISPDQRVYTFYLRPHLRFADGRKVTSADFVAAIQRALGPDGSTGAGPFYLSMIQHRPSASGPIPAVAAVGPEKVRITLSRPAPYFLAELAFPASYVPDPSLYQRFGGNWTDHASGFGPYMVRSWQHGQSLTLVRNRYYYRGRPGLSRVTVRLYQKVSQVLAAYQQGSLDLISGLEAGTGLDSHPAGLRTLPGLALDYLAFNTAKLPFHHLNARRAFAALAPSGLAQQVMGSAVVPARSFLPPAFGSSPPLWRPRVSGKAYLARAGYSAQQKFPAVTFVYPRDAGVGNLASALSRTWGTTLHVTVNVSQLNASNYAAVLNAHAFDLALVRWGADYPDPQDFLGTQLGPGRDNITGWAPHSFNHLLTVADSASSARRLALYQMAGKMATSKLAILPLDEPAVHAVIRPRLQGVDLTPLGTITGDWVHVHFAR